MGCPGAFIPAGKWNGRPSLRKGLHGRQTEGEQRSAMEKIRLLIAEDNSELSDILTNFFEMSGEIDLCGTDARCGASGPGYAAFGRNLRAGKASGKAAGQNAEYYYRLGHRVGERDQARIGVGRMLLHDKAV